MIILENRNRKDINQINYKDKSGFQTLEWKSTINRKTGNKGHRVMLIIIIMIMNYDNSEDDSDSDSDSDDNDDSDDSDDADRSYQCDPLQPEGCAIHQPLSVR